MIKKTGAFTLALMMVASPLTAEAHIMNADNMYNDIAQSEHKDAILYAHALHLIAVDSSLFKPEAMLTNKEFATWYAAFKGWQGSEADNMQRAIDEGVIVSKQGDVTYSVINEALFEGYLKMKRPDDTMTRGEYAAFIMHHASDKLKNKKSLVKNAGYEVGPTGIIEKVEQIDEEYSLTIDDKTYLLADHPSVDNDTTDPLVWQGEEVTTSITTEKAIADRSGKATASDEEKIQYLVVEAPKKEAQPTATSTEQYKKDVKEEAEQQSFSSQWLWGILLVVFIGITGFIFKKKKRG